MNRASWSGQLAFVIAAAASAIGLGNLWRFPYLAAKYGGGTFILVYLCLVVTLGFTLMLSEIAMGRKTQRTQLTSYDALRKGRFSKFVGIIATIIPLVIAPYYSVIGGWVLKYLCVYAKMAFTGTDIVCTEEFFNSFITSSYSPMTYAMIFILTCGGVIQLGVKNGIEKSNLVLMPLLFLMAIAISVYVICMPGSGEGLKYYLVPNMAALSVDGKFSFALLGKTILGAMGQMFYSLSLSAGVMVTYGSYMKKRDNIEKCVRRIEFFDTLIAIVAGLMIVPVVYMFAVKTGTPVSEAMGEGPGLMFVTLPKVFAEFGRAGAWVGFTFFLLVTFAAVTSAISLMEATVASVCDVTKYDRKSAARITTYVVILLAMLPAFGYGIWSNVRPFGMNLLGFFDFLTNSVLMPVTATLTCIFIGWLLKPQVIVDEVEEEGNRFLARGFYKVMVKYFAPALVIAILVSEICRALEIGGWKI